MELFWVVDYVVYTAIGQKLRTRDCYNSLHEAEREFNKIQSDAHGSYFLKVVNDGEETSEEIIETKGQGYLPETLRPETFKLFPYEGLN